MNGSTTRLTRSDRRGISIIFIAAVIGCIFLILTVITNTHWIPVFIPNLPWLSDPVLFAFETPLIAALASAFAFGCLITFVIWRAVYSQAQAAQGILRQQIDSLENTLEKTQRLISTATVETGSTPNLSETQE